MVEVKVTEAPRTATGTTGPATSTTTAQTTKAAAGTTQPPQGSQTTNIAVPPKGASASAQPAGATSIAAPTAGASNDPSKGANARPGPDNATFKGYTPSPVFWQALWSNGSKMARQWMVGMSQRAPHFENEIEVEDPNSDIKRAQPSVQPTPAKAQPVPAQTQPPVSQAQAPPLVGSLTPQIPKSTAPPFPPKTWWEDTWEKSSKTDRDTLIQVGSREEGWTRILSRAFPDVGPSPSVASGPWPINSPNPPGKGMQVQTGETESRPETTLSPIFWHSLIFVKSPVVPALSRREKLWRATLPESQRSQLERTDAFRAVAEIGSTPLPSEPFWNVLWKTSQADWKLMIELINRQKEVKSYLRSYWADPDRFDPDGDDPEVVFDDPIVKPRQPGKP